MIRRVVMGFALAGVTVTVLTLAGCGGADEAPLLKPVPYPGDWPREASVAVLQVDLRGGLPPPEPSPDRFSDVPDVVLFGDGRAVWRQGGGFLEARLEEEGVRMVLGWAEAAGLLAETDAETDTGEPDAFDLPSARYVVTTDSGSTETVVRAPGMERESEIGLTDEQQDARGLIAQADERFHSLGDEIPPDLFTMEPGRLRGVAWELLTRRAGTYPELTGEEPGWTFDDPRLPCRVIEGRPAHRLEGLLSDVGRDPGEASLWEFMDRRWVAFARPLLPGSAAPCPPAIR